MVFHSNPICTTIHVLEPNLESGSQPFIQWNLRNLLYLTAYLTLSHYLPLFCMRRADIQRDFNSSETTTTHGVLLNLNPTLTD